MVSTAGKVAIGVAVAGAALGIGYLATRPGPPPTTNPSPGPTPGQTTVVFAYVNGSLGPVTISAGDSIVIAATGSVGGGLTIYIGPNPGPTGAFPYAQGSTFDAEGEFTWSPFTLSAPGVYYVGVVDTDSGETSNWVEVTVNPTGGGTPAPAPVATVDGRTGVIEVPRQPFELQATAGTPSGPAALYWDAAPDGVPSFTTATKFMSGTFNVTGDVTFSGITESATRGPYWAVVDETSGAVSNWVHVVVATGAAV